MDISILRGGKPTLSDIAIGRGGGGYFRRPRIEMEVGGKGVPSIYDSERPRVSSCTGIGPSEGFTSGRVEYEWGSAKRFTRSMKQERPGLL